MSPGAAHRVDHRVGPEPLTLLIVSWYSWCSYFTNLSVSVNQ